MAGLDRALDAGTRHLILVLSSKIKLSLGLNYLKFLSKDCEGLRRLQALLARVPVAHE